MDFFLSQRPRKSPSAVMSTSRETPCITLVINRMTGLEHRLCKLSLLIFLSQKQTKNTFGGKLP